MDADGIVGVLRRAQAWESALDGGRVGRGRAMVGLVEVHHVAEAGWPRQGVGGTCGSASHGGKRAGRGRAMAGLVGAY